MGRRLVERRTCDECGQVVETLDDGTEVGHAAPHGPSAVPEEPAPEPGEAADADAEAGDRATQPAD